MEKNTTIIPFQPVYIVCVDYYDKQKMSGNIYYGNEECKKKVFSDVTNLIFQLESLMENKSSVKDSVKYRTFGISKEIFEESVDAKEREKVFMSSMQQTEKKGEKATFMLQVQFKQNATWQGTIKWLEKKKELKFRSALEMIKIIDSACEKGYNVETIESVKEEKIIL